MKAIPSMLWLSMFLVLGCTRQNPNADFIGFWEGPHPESEAKKFYIQIENSGDSLAARGYWTHNRFYQESFVVDRVHLDAPAIEFSIPDWGCRYRGIRTDRNNIRGGFDCSGEAFDSVNLVKNQSAITYLIESKPGSTREDFAYRYVKPAKSVDELATARFDSPKDSTFIYSLLSEIIKGKYGRLNAFLLFKDNFLVCEEYFYGYAKEDLHPIESCTKSLTSLLIGIAKDQGLITDLNQPLYQLFPEYPHLTQGDYRSITLANLLTMTSGYAPAEEDLYRSANRLEEALNRDLSATPGTTFQYDGGNTEILGGILKKRTGMFADVFAQKYLFEPLHISSYNWDIHKQDGYPGMAGSLHLRPRDMGKIGLLVLNKGSFSGTQVISENWIEESCSVKTASHIPGDNYSYQWWNLRLSSNGKSYPCIWANGWGSQFIYIFPELRVVIVTTGHNYEENSWLITDGISKHLHLLDN